MKFRGTLEHFEKFESYIPVNLMEPRWFFMASVLLFLIIVLRYFLFAGIFWLIFYKARPAALIARQIYPQLPGAKIQLTEIKWSLITSLVFAISGALMGLFWQMGWTQLYLKMDQFGWLYFFLSLFLMSLFHDFYFYWTHRWLHSPWAYRKFHAVHHRSLNPSPWASFSFHPVESLIAAAAIPLLILFIPIHPVMLIVYLTLMSLSAVTNHLGFEILPKNSENGIAKWVVSGVHHAGHHKYFKYNFGLFYTFFDRLFHTEHPHFQKDYKNVFERKIPR